MPYDTGEGGSNNVDNTGVVDEPADVSWMVVQAGTHELPGGIRVTAGKETFTPDLGSGRFYWDVKGFERKSGAYSFSSPPALFAMVRPSACLWYV